MINLILIVANLLLGAANILIYTITGGALANLIVGVCCFVVAGILITQGLDE